MRSSASDLGREVLPAGGREFHALLFFAALSVVLVYRKQSQFLWVFLLVFAAWLGCGALMLKRA